VKITLAMPDRYPKRKQKIEEFFQKQCNRLAVGCIRHQAGKDEFGNRAQDYIKRLKQVIKKYENSGNLEFLIDAANYCALEFYNSNHPDQHFKSEDSGGRTSLNNERF
jgi:hypothetical protein